MWSFNRDGESDPDLKRSLEAALGIDEQDKRDQRQRFVELAHPQCGVDALADQFAGTRPVPGVVDRDSR